MLTKFALPALAILLAAVTPAQATPPAKSTNSTATSNIIVTKTTAAKPGTKRASTIPSDYGFAGIVYGQTAGGHSVVLDLIPDSPASKSELLKDDVIIDFKLEGKSKATYRELRKEISYNPGKTLVLTVVRMGDANSPRTIKMKISSPDPNAHPEQLQAMIQKRQDEIDTQPVADVFDKIYGGYPNLVEVFTDRPSSAILQARLMGVKAISTHQGSSLGHSLADAGLPIGSQSILAMDSRLQFIQTEPGLFNKASDIVNAFIPKAGRPKFEDFVKSFQQQPVNDTWPVPGNYPPGSSRIVFNTQGGSIGPETYYLFQVPGTWTNDSDTTTNKNKKIALSPSDKRKLESCMAQTFELLNIDLLDSLEGKRLLAGEMLRAGNSIKAGVPNMPAYGHISALSTKDTTLIPVSGSTVVARVHQIGQAFDSYLFFMKDKSGTWKLTAIRTPNEGERTAKETAGIMDDDKIKSWFSENQPSLEPLARGCINSLKPHVIYFADDKSLSASSAQLKKKNEAQRSNSSKTSDETAEIIHSLSKLGLGAALRVRTSDMFLLFPRSNNSDAGLMYCQSNDPPPVNPYGCIWCEKLDEHWYLVRTADNTFFPVLPDRGS